jgi:hypothetical protein
VAQCETSLVSDSENEVVTEVHHTLERLGEEEESKWLPGGGGFDGTTVLFTTRWGKEKMQLAHWFFREVVLGRSG